LGSIAAVVVPPVLGLLVDFGPVGSLGLYGIAPQKRVNRRGRSEAAAAARRRRARGQKRLVKPDRCHRRNVAPVPAVGDGEFYVCHSSEVRVSCKAPSPSPRPWSSLRPQRHPATPPSTWTCRRLSTCCVAHSPHLRHVPDHALSPGTTALTQALASPPGTQPLCSKSSL